MSQKSLNPQMKSPVHLAGQRGLESVTIHAKEVNL